jgi:hypothetical protein
MTAPTAKDRPTVADWLARAAAISPRNDAFIDGRFTPAASGQTFQDIAGRDGSRITDVAQGDVEDVDRAVRAARTSFDDRRWSDQSPADRKHVLLKLAELMRANRDELALLESLDVGKPIRDTLAVDVPWIPRRAWARWSMTGSSPRSSATSTSAGRRARAWSPAAHGFGRTAAASSSSRPSSTASTTRGASRARRSSGRC